MLMSNYSQDLAAQFVQDTTHRKEIAFIKEVDAFAKWDPERNYWKIMKLDEFHQFCLLWLIENMKGKNISSSLVKDFANLIKWMIYKKIDRINTPYISFNDKIFNTQTFLFEEPDSAYPSFLFQDYDTSRLNEATPRWDKFLSEVLVDKDMDTDERLITYMYEILGYMMVPEIKSQAMFYLVGSGQNGKSIFLNLLQRIIGPDFVSASNIQSLTTENFTLPGLIGKRVNICNEEESKYVQADKFKALISGDPIETRRLYGERFTFIPTVKFIFATNHIPQFNTWDGGIERRVRIIPFHRRIEDHKVDPDLFDKLVTEIPGIMGKIIERGIKPLVSGGFKMKVPRTVTEATREFKYNTSPIDAFIETAMEPAKEVGGGVYYSNHDIYHMYRQWSHDTGRKPVKSRTFWGRFNKIYPDCPQDRHYDHATGTSQRGRYIILKTDGEVYEI